MKKHILFIILLTLTILSCSTTKKVKVNFTYLDHPNYITEYYTTGREELLLDLLNVRYFDDLNVKLVMGGRTRVKDTTLYSFRNTPDSLMSDLWYDNYYRYKSEGGLSLLIKHFESPIIGMGYDGVMIMSERYLMKPSFLHEFGHACGLKHTEDICNVMYPSEVNGIDQTELTPAQKLIILKHLKKIR